MLDRSRDLAHRKAEAPEMHEEARFGKQEKLRNPELLGERDRPQIEAELHIRIRGMRRCPERLVRDVAPRVKAAAAAA